MTKTELLEELLRNAYNATPNTDQYWEVRAFLIENVDDMLRVIKAAKEVVEKYSKLDEDAPAIGIAYLEMELAAWEAKA